MGDHLRVDLGELADTAAALDTLCKDFQSAGDVAKGAADDLGSPALSKAMHEFANNWDYHRRKLVKLLKAVHDMAEEGGRVYAEVDSELTGALQKASGGDR